MSAQVRPVWRHVLRLCAAVAVTGLLVGSSASATSAPVPPSHTQAFTPVPGEDSSEWLMMGVHCGASLS